jgi:hypothetical protein
MKRLFYTEQVKRGKGISNKEPSGVKAGRLFLAQSKRREDKKEPFGVRAGRLFLCKEQIGEKEGSPRMNANEEMLFAFILTLTVNYRSAVFLYRIVTPVTLGLY